MTVKMHTPGPWKIEMEDGDKHIRSASGESLMCDSEYYPWTPNNPKDWELIAAAPEMLQELKFVSENIGHDSCTGDDPRPDVCIKCCVDRVIKKAIRP